MSGASHTPPAFKLTDEQAAEAIAKLFIAGRMFGETDDQIADKVETMFRFIDPARVRGGVQ